jgi:hypothetical protein
MHEIAVHRPLHLDHGDASNPGAQHPFAIGGEPVGGIERPDAIEHGATDAQAVDGARPAEQEVGIERRRRALVGAGDRPGFPGAVHLGEGREPARDAGVRRLRERIAPCRERARQQHVVGIEKHDGGRTRLGKAAVVGLVDRGAGRRYYPHPGVGRDLDRVVARAAIDQHRLETRILGGEARERGAQMGRGVERGNDDRDVRRLRSHGMRRATKRRAQLLASAGRVETRAAGASGTFGLLRRK